MVDTDTDTDRLMTVSAHSFACTDAAASKPQLCQQVVHKHKPSLIPTTY
jgi:hypothetical protein